MFKRPVIQFSILTLLVVMTLAAVSVSHVRTSWELAQAKRDVQLARRQMTIQNNAIRHLNDSLGRLTVTDPAKVHVINASPCWLDGTFDEDRPPHYSCWRLYLPEGSRWKVWWAAQNIPADGLPEKKSGGFELNRDAGGIGYLSAQFSKPLDFGFLIHAEWALDVSNASDAKEPVWLSPEEARWLSSRSPVSWTGTGGDQNAAPHTKMLPLDQPIVLQRIRRLEKESSGQTAKPSDGFMIWLEPF